MKKRNIIIGIIVVLIIAVIVAIIVTKKPNIEVNNNNDSNQVKIEPENITISEEGNIFKATVITNEENKIDVVPDKDTVIWESDFKMVKVLINNTTVINKKDGTVGAISDIQEKAKVEIEFDGKILSTGPATIIAKTIKIK